MKLSKIPPIEKECINVVVETPRNSQNKFVYEPKMKIIRLKKTLPMGAIFPFDFGFIPNTKGDDGDPLDVLVIMDQHAYPGCLIQCRVIGILEAWQEEKNKPKERNDRLIAVANCSILYSDLTDVKHLNKHMAEEIENFFIDYNKNEGRKFKPIQWSGKDVGMKMIKQQLK